jgi:ArsR family transcriptional regulator, arsenate/arsenite/antimonite-responsive transcriptional repressor
MPNEVSGESMESLVVGIPRGFREIVVSMPRHHFPDENWPDDLAFALRVFSMPSRAMILVELRKDGPLLRAELIERLEMGTVLVGRTLGDLEKLGIVEADIPAGKRHGRSVKYSVNRELYDRIVGAWTNYLMARTESDRGEAGQ